MHRNNIFFNRQIMIEKDFLDKAPKNNFRDIIKGEESSIDI